MAFFVLSLCPFDISISVGAFVIGLGQISSFLSLCVDRAVLEVSIKLRVTFHDIFHNFHSFLDDRRKLQECIH